MGDIHPVPIPVRVRGQRLGLRHVMGKKII